MPDAKYIVDTYDVADDPSQEGEWTERAQCADLDALAETLAELYGQGYSSVSISVWADDDHLPEEEWPETVAPLIVVAKGEDGK